MHLNVARAIATPSKVDVPRPSSSSATKDRGVARAKMRDVRCSSAMKVDMPCKRASVKSTDHTRGRADAEEGGGREWAGDWGGAVYLC